MLKGVLVKLHEFIPERTDFLMSAYKGNNILKPTAGNLKTSNQLKRMFTSIPH
jgi:hypothetical protein